MAQQTSHGNRPKLSEKGLLTPDNCVVALIDHQPQMLADRTPVIQQVDFIFDRFGAIAITAIWRGPIEASFDVARLVLSLS